MTPLLWSGDGRLRSAAAAGAKLLVQVSRWQPGPADQLTTGAGETAAVILSGTFDLQAAGTAWPARGARLDPFGGRPMAVFLPPRTTFRAERGAGELVLVEARQPLAPAPDAGGREALARKPLLPLAGSGKAFDPLAGAWLPAESFPTAAESLPPRRMERIAIGPVTVERVLLPHYKAATISIDEAVVPAGASFAVDAVPARARAAELLVFVRSAAPARVRQHGAEHATDGDAALWTETTGGDAGLTIAAGSAPAYVLLAWAGKP